MKVNLHVLYDPFYNSDYKDIELDNNSTNHDYTAY